MGLPARQRRMLGRIEVALRGSDPRLAALYSIFARLTRDEEMPRVEQLRHWAVQLPGRLRRRLGSVAVRVFGRLIPRQRALLLFPVGLSLAVASIVIGFRSGPAPNCEPVMQLAATAAHAPGSKLCKDQPAMGMYVGH
jgi:hypothetical protein